MYRGVGIESACSLLRALFCVLSSACSLLRERILLFSHSRWSSTAFEELLEFGPWPRVAHILSTETAASCLFDAILHHIEAFD